MQVGTNVGTGTILKGRFELLEVVGVGGMGTVYKALDRLAQEAQDREPYLAIKLLNAEFLEDRMFFVAMQREAKKAKSLAHPNIVAVYDFDRDGPNFFLSMEFLNGCPLNNIIREHPRGMPFKQAWPIIQGMAAALAHAHNHGIVHSDFKPGNVFIDDKQRVKVLDFGIACPFDKPNQKDSDATVFHSRSLNALSPAYASLEMLEGLPPDPRDDIYALACVAYELLSGRHPYARSSAQQALELNAEPAPLPSLGKKQWRGLAQALMLTRDNRTKTVEEFLLGLSPPKGASVGQARWLLVLGAVVGISFLAWLARGVIGTMTQTQTIAESTETAALSRMEEKPTAAIATPHESRPVNFLDVSLSEPSYTIGEGMVLFVEAKKPMYVTLVHISSVGQVSTIYPNGYEPSNWINAGIKVRIPAANAGYELTVSGPPGTDHVEALGSEEPIADGMAIFDSNGALDRRLEGKIVSRVRLNVPVGY